MKPVIYLSGPISGNPDFLLTFRTAAELLTAKGWTVLNPAVLPEGLPQKAYMAIDTAMLMQATAVGTLPGWSKSEGARAEVALARKCRIPVITTDWAMKMDIAGKHAGTVRGMLMGSMDLEKHLVVEDELHKYMTQADKDAWHQTLERHAFLRSQKPELRIVLHGREEEDHGDD